jgi:hypothetical protein
MIDGVVFLCLANIKCQLATFFLFGKLKIEVIGLGKKEALILSQVM